MSEFKVVKLEHSETDSSPVKHDIIDISCLSKEQKIAYEKYVNGENIFVTGPGGTGKTKLVQYITEYSKEVNKNVPICAMTGCAAVLLGNKARTIHSWSGIKLAKGPKDRIIAGVLKNRNAVREWKEATCLVLDEVSMLSQKIFEILEELVETYKDKIIFINLLK